MYWLGRYLDLVTLTYFLRSSDLDTFCVDVRYLLNYKAYNHQTLQSASSQCTDSADTLTCWPWPIFCAPLTLTQFMLTFQIFSTIKRTTTKPCIVLLLDVLTQQVPWPGDLDLYFALQWLWHILRRLLISSAIRPTTIKPCKSASSQCTDSADTLTWWPWPIFWLQWLWHNLLHRSRSPQV